MRAGKGDTQWKGAKGKIVSADDVTVIVSAAVGKKLSLRQTDLNEG